MRKSVVITCTLVYALWLFICAMLGSTPFGHSSMGTLGASTALAVFHLAGIWCVLGMGSYGYRCLLVFAIGGFIAASALGGYCIAMMITGASTFYDSDMISVLSVLPILFALVQIPSWLFRLCFGWRIIVQGEPEDQSGTPISIADLMIVTTFVAFGLAALQFGSSTNLTTPGAASTESNRMLAVGALFAVGPNLLFSLPCLAIVLSEKDNRLRSMTILAACILLVILVGVVIIPQLISKPTAVRPAELSFAAGTFLSFTLPLLTMRKHGLVLLRPRQRR